jgi:hypothetical protein
MKWPAKEERQGATSTLMGLFSLPHEQSASEPPYFALQAGDWTLALHSRPEILAKWPVPCPRSWVEHVNAVQSEAELAALARSMTRGTPFGGES